MPRRKGVTSVTISSGGTSVTLGEHKLPAQRLENALTKLQDAQSALKLAAEELAIVDAEILGSDAHRRLIVEASKEDPIKVSDDIESHRSQTAEIAQFAADVGKLAKAVKGKASFIGAALGSVYSVELLAGDEERVRLKDRKQPNLFEDGNSE